MYKKMIILMIILSKDIKNNYNSDNNDLKDEQNHRFEKKETLIWTRNWSGLYVFLKYKHYTKSSSRQRPEEKKVNKKIKNKGIYNTCHGPLS